MKDLRQFEQHLRSLRAQGNTEITVNIDMLLNILSQAKHRNEDTQAVWSAPRSIQVDGGDFSSDNG